MNKKETEEFFGIENTDNLADVMGRVALKMKSLEEKIDERDRLLRELTKLVCKLTERELFPWFLTINEEGYAKCKCGRPVFNYRTKNKNYCSKCGKKLIWPEEAK